MMKGVRKYPDKASVVAELQRRVGVGFPIDATSLVRGIEMHKDTVLYSWGFEYFGGWKAAIDAAGFSYEKARRKPSRRYPGKASVISEIQRRSKAGLPLNGLAVAKGEHKDTMLHIYGQEYFGRWRAALEAAGISPAEVCHKYPKRYPDKASVVEGIRRRVKIGLPLSGFSISKKDQADVTLYNCGRKYFGSWRQALEAAGLDYEKIKKGKFGLRCQKYPDNTSVVREIRRRHEAGLPIDFEGVFEKKDRDRSLHQAALDKFCTWGAAVEAAGFEYKGKKMPTSGEWRRFPDACSVVKEIQRRVKDGLLISSAEVMHGEHRNPALPKAAQLSFGSWGAAVEAAGFDYDAIRNSTLQKHRGADAVIEEIQRRVRIGLPINANAIKQGEHHDRSLMHAGKMNFGSWGAAVEAAGFEYARVCYPIRRKYKDGDSVVAEIRRRHEAGFPINTFAVKEGELADNPLFYSGVKCHGSWIAALEAAGIDPASVRPRRGNPKKKL